MKQVLILAVTECGYMTDLILRGLTVIRIKKRGCEAMDEIAILPNFKGTLYHNRWKPYYKYACLHTLCNAHNLRKLIVLASRVTRNRRKRCTHVF
ncbi:MAG: hypothetical protein ACI84K_000849 [Pseudohongiellaceae bacterium]|jgi:hypothetical protein